MSSDIVCVHGLAKNREMVSEQVDELGRGYDCEKRLPHVGACLQCKLNSEGV